MWYLARDRAEGMTYLIEDSDIRGTVRLSSQPQWIPSHMTCRRLVDLSKNGPVSHQSSYNTPSWSCWLYHRH
ncbi:hypothetical protein BJV78DRAFT_1192600, partial [Lactifluus subvellereus]